MRNPLDECLRKFVVIEADGIRYFGTLVEVGEEEAILRTEARWIGVPVDKIASVREIEPAAVHAVEIEEVDAETFVPGDEVDETADDDVADDDVLDDDEEPAP